MIPSIRFDTPKEDGSSSMPVHTDPGPSTETINSSFGTHAGTNEPTVNDGTTAGTKDSERTRHPSSSSTSSFSSTDTEAEDPNRLSTNGWQNFTRNTRRLSNTATHMIIKVPVHMKRVAETKGISSWQRETKHFVSITAMHGVKRVYESHRFYKLFWALMVIFCAGLMIQQLQTIIASFNDRPINTQLAIKRMKSSFGGSESDDEVLFPKITICNFNPIRKSYVRQLNATGDFSLDMLRYLMLFNNDVLTTFGNGNEKMLLKMDRELAEYGRSHPNFTFHRFFYDAGFLCKDILKSCSFAGRPFDCCRHSKARLTSLGRCHELTLSEANVEWMKKQTEGGDKAGLQIVLDAHLHEQVKDIQDNTEAVLSNQFENGFRFYVVEPATSTYTSSQGINVSPGDCVYSALVARKFELLKPSEWGNCTDEWPEGYSGNNTRMKYQSLDCMTKCKARTFNQLCGCSPFIYDIDNEYASCTPLETYRCMKNHILINVNETTEEFSWPQCDECRAECQKWEFPAYNSYSHGFTGAALSWLQAKNVNWTEEIVNSNFLTINVFFRDMTYSVFRQEQASSLVQTLSNMGGTMGLFLGMSVLTMIEGIIYIWKVIWIAASSKRRSYMADKKRREEEETRETDETIKTMRGIGSTTLKDAMDHLQDAAGSIKKWRPKFSVGSKPSSKPSTPIGPPPIAPWSKQSIKPSTTTDPPAASGYDNETFNDDVFEPVQDEVIELAINLDDLKREIRKQSGLGMEYPPHKRRSTSYKSPALGRTRKHSEKSKRRNMSLSGLPPSSELYADGPPTPIDTPTIRTFDFGGERGPHTPKTPSPLSFSAPTPQTTSSHLEVLPPMEEDSAGEEAARSRKGSREVEEKKKCNEDSNV